MYERIGLLLVTFAALVQGESCDQSKCIQIPNHYMELGCQPVKETDGCCPVRVDCPMIPDDKKCHNKGKSYNVGDVIPDDEHPICQAACRCSEVNGINEFNCASIECPEIFAPPPSNCVPQPVPNECCPEYVCDEKRIAELSKTTCYVDGVKYVKGQKMYPSECSTCTCVDGFDNRTIENNPHCTKVDCNIEFHYGQRWNDGCIPIYYGDASCCPTDWRCPTSSDAIVSTLRSKETIPTDPQMMCTFGKLKLEIGEELNAERDGVSCKCEVPPHPHCIQKPHED